MVGLGPCGELRYPAYQESGNKWSYFGPEMESASGLKVQRGIPGIGEFQVSQTWRAGMSARQHCMCINPSSCWARHKVMLLKCRYWFCNQA